MFGWSSSCLISISCLEQVVKEGELREATKTPTTTLNELNASSAETGDTTHPATVAQHLHHAEGKCVTSGVHWRHVGDRRVKKVRSQNQEPGPDLVITRLSTPVVRRLKSTIRGPISPVLLFSNSVHKINKVIKACEITNSEEEMRLISVLFFRKRSPCSTTCKDRS